MAWVACDKDGSEFISLYKPEREGYNQPERDLSTGKIWLVWTERWKRKISIPLPKGSIKKLIGRALSFADEPVKLE